MFDLCIGVGAGKFLGVRKIFTHFLNLPEIFLCALPINFSCKDHENLFGMTSKTSLCVFLKTLGAIV